MTSTRLRSWSALIIAILFLLPLQALGQEEGKNQKVLSTHTVRGRFTGVEQGDFFHAIIKGRRGVERDYYIDDGSLEFYLAANVDKPGVFTIQRVRDMIPQEGPGAVSERLSDAKYNGVTFKQWWKRLRKHHTEEQIAKIYQPMVDKITKGG